MTSSEENKTILEFVNSVQEFYSLEDYGNCTMIQALNKIQFGKEKINPQECVSVVFFINKKQRQMINKINTLKKVFFFIKVIYQEKSMNFLINRNDNYTGNDILSKINTIRYLKSSIKAYLNISEFPITSYYLSEINNVNKDLNIDKIYELKDSRKNAIGFLNPLTDLKTTIIKSTVYKGPNNPNNNMPNNKSQNSSNYLNMNHNNNEFNNLLNNNNNLNYNMPNNNNHFNMNNNMSNNNFSKMNNNNSNNIICELENKLNEEKEKNKNLEIELYKEKNKNKELEEIIYSLKNEIKEKNKIKPISNNEFEKESLYKAILERDKEIKELKEKLSRFPLELNAGEKLMVVNFRSVDQKLQNYSIICKNTDIFNKLENKLYQDNPDLYETANYFTVGGNKIHKNKSLEFNNIKNNDIIILNILDI